MYLIVFDKMGGWGWFVFEVLMCFGVNYINRGIIKYKIFYYFVEIMDKMKQKFGIGLVFFMVIFIIFGVIMFLCFGFVVGSVGFLGIIVIIFIGYVVMILMVMVIVEIVIN